MAALADSIESAALAATAAELATEIAMGERAAAAAAAIYGAGDGGHLGMDDMADRIVAAAHELTERELEDLDAELSSGGAAGGRRSGLDSELRGRVGARASRTPSPIEM